MDSGPLPSSVELSRAFDVIGYSKFMIERRRKLFQLYGERASHMPAALPRSLKGMKFKVHLVGSRIEGTTVEFKSDQDFMIVLEAVQCSKHKPQSEDGSNKCWIKLITEKVEPGYALLQPSPADDSLINRFMKKCSVQHNGELFVSSIKLNEQTTNIYQETRSKYESSAAMDPLEDNLKLKFLNSELNNMDVVFAFPCVDLDFMTEWETRQRKHGWPAVDTIEKIKQMCAYIVPRSSNISNQSHLEFRICHTLGELELVKSLNETQIKVYIFLKELVKSEVFEKHQKIFTSYVLKNVVFWLCETNPSQNFTVDLLLDRVKDALKYIYKCIELEPFLPNYFIPMRNLLSSTIKPDNIQEIRKILARLIDEGDHICWTIKPLKEEITKIRQNNQQDVDKKIAFRNQQEIEFLQNDISWLEETIQDDTEKLYEFLEKFLLDA